MTNRTHIKWGWVLLIVFGAAFIGFPPGWIVVGCIMFGFKIPRCFWDWFYVKLGKEKISQ